MVGRVNSLPLLPAAALVAGVACSPDDGAPPRRGCDPSSPSHEPDRVILTWSDNPATTQSVTWRTDVAVAKAMGQIARTGPGPAFDPYGAVVRPNPGKVTTVAAATERLDSDRGAAHYHSVTFRDLEPEGQYVYRVGDGETWSAWYQFRTASDRPEPVRFLYFGDAQNAIGSHWSRVVRGAFAAMPRAHFMLHAGDLINHANADAQWAAWHEAGGWIHATVPSLPSPGNHEYARGQLTDHWRRGFTLPENGPPGLEETAYFVDIQGVRVVSLNSNDKIDVQAAWLDRVLTKNPNRWTIITFHHPVYSTARGRDNAELREAWRPVFDEHAPDLVLQGHDHTYGRSGSMKGDAVLPRTSKDERGTVYVVSVSGPKMYELEGGAWMRKGAQNVQLYQLVTIDGGTLRYEARTADGVVYDELMLSKTVEGSTGEALRDPKLAGPQRGAARSPAAPPGWRVTPVQLGLAVCAGLSAVVAAFVLGRRQRKA